MISVRTRITAAVVANDGFCYSGSSTLCDTYKGPRVPCDVYMTYLSIAQNLIFHKLRSWPLQCEELYSHLWFLEIFNLCIYQSIVSFYLLFPQ